MKQTFRVGRILLSGLALVTALCPAIQAGVITFEGQPVGAMAQGASFQEAGFTITATTNPSNHPTDQATIYNTGSNLVVGDGDITDFFGTLLDITLTGGGTFNVTSLDTANLGTGGSGSNGQCGSGDRIDVGAISAGCFSISPIGSGLTTIPVNLTGLTDFQLNFVSFGGANFVVDNIVASPSAPEPASMLLAVAGLAGFAIRRRFGRPVKSAIH